MAPSIKIKAWTWEKVTTERQVNNADSIALVSHGITGAEKVRAVFQVIDPEPFPRTRGAKKLVLPEVLVVELNSANGQPWTVGWKTSILATNVLQGGGVGARVDIDRVWFPDWAKECTADQSDSPVIEWINAEYPR